MGLRYYANAPATTLASSCTSGATTVTVTATTGFPISYPYTIIVDRGLATEEVMSVTNAAGTTLTVTRGYDTTTAFAHSAGASVGHGFSAIDPREANVHVNASSAVHGLSGSVVGTTDTQTLSAKTLTSPKVNLIADTNGNEEIIFTTTASAVNEITVANAATAGKPTISATGGDTNISLNLVPKGTGTVQANAVDVVTTSGTQTLTNKTLTTPQIAQINSTTGNLAATTHEGVASAVNYVRLLNSATGNAVSVGAGGTDTNIVLNLFSKGSGVVTANGIEVATTTATQTLTNKTLSTGTLVGASTTDLSAAWVSYTPTWTAVTTNPTLGNGTIAAAYMKIGKTVHFRVKVTFGTTTTLGSGAYGLTLPTPANSAVDVDGGVLVRTSGGSRTVGISWQASTTETRGIMVTTDTALSDATRAWANGDSFSFAGTYEAA